MPGLGKTRDHIVEGHRISAQVSDFSEAFARDLRVELVFHPFQRREIFDRDHRDNKDRLAHFFYWDDYTALQAAVGVAQSTYGSEVDYDEIVRPKLKQFFERAGLRF